LKKGCVRIVHTHFKGGGANCHPPLGDALFACALESAKWQIANYGGRL
jgi:ribosomal protein L11